VIDQEAGRATGTELTRQSVYGYARGRRPRLRHPQRRLIYLNWTDRRRWLPICGRSLAGRWKTHSRPQINTDQRR